MKASWFSAGVSSAIATKIALEKYTDLEILYIHIEDQHEDSLRFLKDCENWFNKKITILQSKLKNVENACLAFGYINGIGGAKCTQKLKKQVRKDFEKENKIDLYVWGFDSSKREIDRSRRLLETMPDYYHFFPLIENNLTKQDAHALLKKAGIARPHMYELGYNNNNCLGCVKGGKGYWNKIRNDFPRVFKSRSELERKIGASCINGVYLDELDLNVGRNTKEILQDCGIACEVLGEL